MNPATSGNPRRAFSLVELLVVIAILAVLVGVFLSGPRHDRAKALQVTCMSHLKQTVIGFVMWSDDNGGSLPWQVSSNQGGTLELIPNGRAADHFLTLSNYLKDTGLLWCPTDLARDLTNNFSGFDNQNLSYFIGLDAITNNPFSILSGDRHLQVNGQLVKPGLLIVSNRATFGWTKELHCRSSEPVGNLSFADGHVEVGGVRAGRLSATFQRQTTVTNRLAIP